MKNVFLKRMLSPNRKLFYTLIKKKILVKTFYIIGVTRYVVGWFTSLRRCVILAGDKVAVLTRRELIHY